MTSLEIYNRIFGLKLFTDDKPSVIILQGVSGSGKSTLANTLKTQGAFVVSADDWFTRGNRYDFDPSQLPAAHGSCLRNYLDVLAVGISAIVVDNTNTTIAEVAPYYALAEAYGYNVKILYVEAPSLDALKRNIHSVPEHTIRKQVDNLRNFWNNAPLFWNHIVLHSDDIFIDSK